MPRAQLPSQVLPSAADTRVREHQYDDLDMGSFLGWDPDSGDFERPVNAFYEMHNYRFENRGTPILRRGVKELHYLNSKEGQTGGAEPYTAIAKAEYAIWTPDGAGSQTELRYDVTLEHEGGTQLVQIVLMDKSADSSAGMQAITIATGVATAPSGCVQQFGLYLIVSLFDDKTYILTPTKLPFGRGDWRVEVLGKDECPTPAKVDFPKTLTGDLICFSAHRKTGGDNDTFGTYELEYDRLSQSSAEILTVRLPIEAQYTRADDAAIAATNIIPQFKFAKKNESLIAGNDGAGGPGHFMHRGWYYRFIMVMTLTLADGTKVKRRSNPSSDLFVPPVNYSPFFWTADRNVHAFPDFVTASFSASWKNGPAGPDSKVVNHVTLKNDWQPVPNNQAMLDLQAKYRKYFNDSHDTDAAGTGGSLHWVAHWLRWNHQGDVTSQLVGPDKLDPDKSATMYYGKPPYQCDVSTQELLGAPETIFDWKDFGITDVTVEAIEVYRTAYAAVDPEKRATETPDFEPHVYGYVGRIERDAVWTDTVKKPDFGKPPERYNGYLRGQMSGDIITDYGQSPALVLGNVRVDYRLLSPGSVLHPVEPSPTTMTMSPQAFWFLGGGGLYDKMDFESLGGDGLPVVQFSYAYLDNNGYLSKAATIGAVTGDSSHGVGLLAGVTVPQGYDTSIEHVMLFRSWWKDSAGWVGARGQDPAGSRGPTLLIATIDPTDGQYISNGAEVGTASSASYPNGDHPRFYEPGAIIYSKPDQPWDWPQKNAEKHHQSAPVRGLFELMGELCVLTENSVTLTLLSSTKPRSETETRWIACVSKFASAKVGEVVVFLAQDGPYVMLPSGPIKLEGQDSKQAGVETVIRQYLEEQIPGQKWLANVRRASMCYHGRRGELLVHLPSSIDLWPADQKKEALPQRTVVYKFFGGDVRNPEHYSFDISPSFEIKNVIPETLEAQTSSEGGVLIGGETIFAGGQPGGVLNFDDASPISLYGPAQIDLGTFTSRRVLMYAGLDGSLWGAWSADDGKSLVLASMDDVRSDYQGSAYLTLAVTKQIALASKKKREMEIRMSARGVVTLTTGFAKRNGSWDAARGPIHDSCRVWSFKAIRPDQMRTYRHPYNGTSRENEGKLVFWRLHSKPDANGAHSINVANIALRLVTQHAQ